MEIDPRFKAAKERSTARRKKTSLPWGWIVGGTSVLGLGGVVGYLVFSGFISFGPPPDIASIEDGDEEITEEAYVSPFIDVAGDPLFLQVEGGLDENTQYLAPPLGLSPGRALGDVALISDTMIARDARLNTTLPTSREDFAFFQSQRAVPTEPVNAATLGTPASTSLAVLRDPARVPATSDVILRLSQDRPIDEVLEETRIDAAARPAFADALGQMAPSGTLQAGSIVATRYLPDAGRRTPLQMTVYDQAGYMGSVARTDEGGAAADAADAWINEDLERLANQRAATQTPVSYTHLTLPTNREV